MFSHYTAQTINFQIWTAQSAAHAPTVRLGQVYLNTAQSPHSETRPGISEPHASCLHLQDAQHNMFIACKPIARFS